LAPHAVRRQKVLKDLSFNPHQERFKAKLTHPQRWVQLPIVEANNLFDTEMVGRLQGRTEQKICTAHYFERSFTIQNFEDSKFWGLHFFF